MKQFYDMLAIGKDFVNPAQLITGALTSGILALFATLILLIIFRKLVLTPRIHISLRILSYTYFIVLPLLAGFFWAKWGAFNALRKGINSRPEIVSRYIPDTYNKRISAATRSFLANNSLSVADMSTNQLIDTISGIVTAKYDTVLAEEQQKPGLNRITHKVLTLLRSRQLSATLKHSVRNVLETKLGLEEDMSKELMATRIDEILRTGFFEHIVLLQVNSTLKKVQKGIITTFCIIMLIPLLEIAIAIYLFRKKTKAQPAAPAIPQAAPLIP